MKQLLSFVATSTTVLGLMVAGVAGASPAVASGLTGATHCQDGPGGSIVVQCVGYLNGTPVTIDIGGIPFFSPGQLSLLANQIDSDLMSVSALPTAQALQQLAVEIVRQLEQLGYHTCTVTVTEPGGLSATAYCQ